MADYKENVEILIKYLGGPGNISVVTNCMTRLRTTVVDESLVDEAKIKEMDDVMGLLHDRARMYEIVVGPGKSRKYADQCHALGLKAAADGSATGKAVAGANAASSASATATAGADWQQNKDILRGGQKGSRIKNALKIFGDIFVPLIPGIITAGLCAGIAALIAQAVPNYEHIKMWNLIYNLLTLVNISFMTYLTAWAGYRAAERFGATPILGGMLGMITSLDGINDIAKLLGLYDASNPLNSILTTGKGGILAVIFGVFLLSIVEKKIRSKMPDSIDVIFTPLLSLLICVVPYVLIIMPLLGYVSSGIVWIFAHLCLSSSIVVRIIAGYVSAALFLPLVATGMHHGLIALYSVQLQEMGYVTLYPALAMAGAGQVGAAIALWIKAKRVGNKKLCSVIGGALPAGFLGVGEPLIYGVTLPLGKPFITAGLGAGFGGALVMAMQVASTTWGPSGLLGLFVMTEGPQGAIKSVLIYLLGLAISYVGGFLITAIWYKASELRPEPAEGTGTSNDTLEVDAETGESVPADGQQLKPTPARDTTTAASPFTEPLDQYHSIKHGEPITLGMTISEFKYTITDPVGIHARPAGKLAEVARKFDCKVTLSTGDKSAAATSPIELINLGASKGTVISVSAEGPDAQAALQAVKSFLTETL